MSAFVIETYLSHPGDEEMLREIFFESSARQTFPSVAAREEFFHKYLGHYLHRYPDLCFVARDSSGGILGYLVGARQTKDPKLLQLQAHLTTFQDLFKDFPAHLHMNSHAAARGQGIGGALFGHFEEVLRKEGVPGLHIMTGPSGRNQAFYERMGLVHKIIRKDILFMGKGII